MYLCICAIIILDLKVEDEFLLKIIDEATMMLCNACTKRDRQEDYCKTN